MQLITSRTDLPEVKHRPHRGAEERAVEAMLGQWGQIDVLVNNAGWDRMPSPAADDVTGQTLSVSGGLTMV